MDLVAAPSHRGRGMVFVHSAPSALALHVEWALAGVLGMPAHLDWIRQPAEPSMVRTEYSWMAEAGTGARIVSALNGWPHLRFEVTEDFSASGMGQRWSYTPTLGIFSAATDAHGDIMISEDRLRNAVLGEELGREPVSVAIDRLLGRPWDDELEIFRHASEDTPVRWLHQAG